MSYDLTDDELGAVVKKVVKEGDLDNLTFNKVFKMVETIVGESLENRKDFIRNLITKLLTEDDQENDQEQEKEEEKEKEKENGNGDAEDEDVKQDDKKEKVKEESTSDSSDSIIKGFSKKEIEEQRLLYEAIKSGSRRTTRGSTTSKRKTVNSNKKKSKKAKLNDDSDNDNENKEEDDQPKQDTGKKARKGGSGLTKLAVLSNSLAEFLGTEEPMARTEVVKRLHAYIKENNLQNPSNKRKIIFDEKLQNVFKKKETDFFKLNQLLSKHVKPADQVI